MRSRIVLLFAFILVPMLVSWANAPTDVYAFEDRKSAPAVAKDPTPPPLPIEPYVKLPKAKTVKPNRYFCLKPDTNCKTVKWIVPDGLEKIDPEIQLKDPMALVLIGESGTYVVQCYGALADQVSDIASCKVTIGTPPPPVPPDPLAAAFQTAYALDTESTRSASLQFLQAAYAGLAQVAPTWSGVKTNTNALAQIKAVIEAPGAGLAATQVVNLRKAIAAEMAKTFGTTANTPITLAALAAELAKIATALKGVQ